MKPVIVIPIYKIDLTNEEKASIKQCAKILGKYDITFVCKQSLDCVQYETIMNELNIAYNYEYFQDEYFNNTLAYSRLLLTKDFYKRFEQYSHMLIYQLDAWVFKDDLLYWCQQPFDYIGAPWFEHYTDSDETSRILTYSGNGGFSLRNIHKIIETLDLYEAKYKFKRYKPIDEIYRHKGYFYVLIHFFEIYPKYRSFENSVEYKMLNTSEDYAIANYFHKFNKNFKVANGHEAISFAFEVLPERLFTMNNKKLPFGCHAFKKYNWNFWKNYIKI